VDEPKQVAQDEASTSKVSEMEREYLPPPFPSKVSKAKEGEEIA
jgi:hypothetical protein